jgi:hypothetical protein
MIFWSILIIASNWALGITYPRRINEKATNLKLHMIGGFAADFLEHTETRDSNPVAKLTFAIIVALSVCDNLLWKPGM